VRLVLAVTVGVIIVLGTASPAAAHAGGAAEPTNYRSRLLTITPSRPGVQARLLDLGQRVRLENHTDTDVIVLGYDNEPYLRVGPDGVFENRRSPTLYRNRTAADGSQEEAPASADVSAPPEWHRTSDARSVTWPDDRAKPPSSEPAEVKAQRDETHVVSQWSIPLQHGSTAVTMQGLLVWVPGSTVWPWVVAVAGLAVLVIVAGRTPWWGQLLSAATALLVATDAVHAVALASADGRGAGESFVRLVSNGYLSMAAWVAGVAAIVGLQRRREGGLLAACFCGVVIAVMSGLTDLPSLTRSQLPGDLPVAFVRFSVAVAIGMGTGLVVAAAMRLRELTAARRALEASS
jgi:hypothetical protein